jgi:hypothetical protein
MKLIVPTAKPRNPFVAASLRRAAGAHRNGPRRQQERQALRLELDRLRPSP